VIRGYLINQKKKKKNNNKLKKMQTLIQKKKKTKYSSIIDRVMHQNRCWNCECELTKKSKPYTYYCPNTSQCKDGEYYSCFLCEKENNGAPLSIDHDSISKGYRCAKCEKYFCLSCRYDYIGYVDPEEDEYYCEECFPTIDQEIKNRIEKCDKLFESFLKGEEKDNYFRNKSLLKSWAK
jgi:hypothetical protein